MIKNTKFGEPEDEEDELKSTIEQLEQEVLDGLENPYKPYSVIFPYEVRFTIPDDGHNTEVIVRSKSEDIRFGRNEKDILLQKEVDNRYARILYSKHILNWVSKKIDTIDPTECDLEYTGPTKVSPIDHHEVKEYIEGLVNDE